jgi:hypothetical protein
MSLRPPPPYSHPSAPPSLVRPHRPSISISSPSATQSRPGATPTRHRPLLWDAVVYGSGRDRARVPGPCRDTVSRGATCSCMPQGSRQRVWAVHHDDLPRPKAPAACWRCSRVGASLPGLCTPSPSCMHCHRCGVKPTVAGTSPLSKQPYGVYATMNVQSLGARW